MTSKTKGLSTTDTRLQEFRAALGDMVGKRALSELAWLTACAEYAASAYSLDMRDKGMSLDTASKFAHLGYTPAEYVDRYMAGRRDTNA